MLSGHRNAKGRFNATMYSKAKEQVPSGSVEYLAISNYLKMRAALSRN